jgi:ribosomal protein S8
VRFNYFHFINHLKLSIARKNFSFLVVVNIQTVKLMSLFQKLNIIRGFYKVSSNKYVVFNSWNTLTPNSIKIKSYSRSSSPIKFKLDTLKVLKKHTFRSFIVLNTTKGILTHQEALRHKVSGSLICIIL